MCNYFFSERLLGEILLIYRNIINLCPTKLFYNYCELLSLKTNNRNKIMDIHIFTMKSKRIAKWF